MAPVDKRILRPVLYYEFLQRHSAAQAAGNICAVFGEDAVSLRTVHRWFSRLDEGDVSFEDLPRSGRPSTVDDEQLQQALKEKPNATTRELSEMLHCHHSSVHDRLQASGYRKVLSKWVPHELCDSDRFSRLTVARSLLLRYRCQNFLKNVVTGDESWMLYVNYTRTAQWLPHGQPPPRQSKVDHHQKKVMLCCWWDSQGILYHEFLKDGTRVTAEVYATQLQKLSEAMQRKRPRRKNVFLLHDNARPHVARTSRQKLEELGWEVLPHTPYSPDMAPSDYHLFRALKQHLRGKQFDNQTEVETEVNLFFESQPPSFWKKGISDLPKKWEMVVDVNGDYFVD